MTNNLIPNTRTLPTNIESEHLKTDKTYETDITIDNNHFLQKLFGEISNNAYPIVVRFKGNPSNVTKQKWFGYPWNHASKVELLPEANNYFSLSRFKPNEAGEYGRKKSQFYELCAVMLDDIGSKAPFERLILEPSWILETSPGNFQVGYILSEPIRDSKIADQLMNAIILAGLCDPGANGPTTRLARLPVAINGKYEPAFHCRLKGWFPDNRYSLHELIDGLQLDLIEPKRKQSHSNKIKEPISADSEQIWTPRPDENAVIAALKNRGLYKSPLGEGKHDIANV